MQGIVNDLAAEALVSFQPNRHDKRELFVLTEKGKETFGAAMNLQTPWINRLSDGLRVADVETIHEVISTLRRRLEAAGDIDDKAACKAPARGLTSRRAPRQLL